MITKHPRKIRSSLLLVRIRPPSRSSLPLRAVALRGGR